MSDEEWRICVENEVLLLLQEELEGMGTCLERFGLPSPDIKNKIQNVPRAIAEEMFDIVKQKEIINMKCEQLNMDQYDAFCVIMKAVQDRMHPQ